MFVEPRPGGQAVWQRLWVPPPGLIEITDLLFERNPDGTRAPIRRASVVQHCVEHRDRWAAGIVAEMPSTDGWLDPEYVDRLMVAVHCEIQRLSEEFRHGARMAELLVPLLATLGRCGQPPPYRVVDVGCGTGYVVRWLSDWCITPDVEFVGVDLNPALVDAARNLAARDGVRCRFEVADAFSLTEPATVLISTGVMHHFRGPDLDRFFAAHERSGAAAFVHLDFQASRLAPIGSWLFHHTRMRLAVTRHDGIRSAQRAHGTDVLSESATNNAKRFETMISRPSVRFTPLPCVLTVLIGTLSGLSQPLLEELGTAARRFNPLR